MLSGHGQTFVEDSPSYGVNFFLTLSRGILHSGDHRSNCCNSHRIVLSLAVHPLPILFLVTSDRGDFDERRLLALIALIALIASQLSLNYLLLFSSNFLLKLGLDFGVQYKNRFFAFSRFMTVIVLNAIFTRNLKNWKMQKWNVLEYLRWNR